MFPNKDYVGYGANKPIYLVKQNYVPPEIVFPGKGIEAGAFLPADFAFYFLGAFNFFPLPL